MSKKLNPFISLALAVLLPFFTYFWGYTAGQASVEPPLPTLPATQAESELDLAMFWKVWRIVESKFVDTEKLEREHMLYGAMKGVVRSLGDPHSEFLDPTESEELLNSLSGSLTGIGAEVGLRDDLLVIVSPLRGSPAERAGLLPGDIVFKIDGELSTNFSLFEAVKRIRGEPGSTVSLSILRTGEHEPREVPIVREFITVESVQTERRPDGIAVITVSTFAEHTAADFAKALTELAQDPPKGVILDLRFNGGGFLDAAVEMVSGLLATGDVVTIRERGLPDQTLPVSGQVILPDTPLVVLINAGSASAAEIMAGSLQDAKRAVVIGEKSFGKGTVQELVNSFADGSTLRVTIAKWYTPSGRDVTADRIAPDIEVKMTNADYEAKRDPQLARAVEELLK